MTEQRNRLKCGILFRVPERRNNGTSSFRVFWFAEKRNNHICGTQVYGIAEQVLIYGTSDKIAKCASQKTGQ